MQDEDLKPEALVAEAIADEADRVRGVVAEIVAGAIQETTFIDDLKDAMASCLVDAVADRAAERLINQKPRAPFWCQRPVLDAGIEAGTGIVPVFVSLPASARPERWRTVVVDQHLFVVTPTCTPSGGDLARYRVECRICGLLVHEETASPHAQIGRHVSDTCKTIDAIAKSSVASSAIRAAVHEAAGLSWDGDWESPRKRISQESIAVILQAIELPSAWNISPLDAAALRWLIRICPIDPAEPMTPAPAVAGR